MEAEVGTAAGATDIAGQRAVLLAGVIQKERVIVPWAGRRDWATRVSGSDAPASRGPGIGKWTKNFRCFRFPKTTVDIFFLQIVPINLTVSPATSDRMRV